MICDLNTWVRCNALPCHMSAHGALAPETQPSELYSVGTADCNAIALIPSNCSWCILRVRGVLLAAWAHALLSISINTNILPYTCLCVKSLFQARDTALKLLV